MTRWALFGVAALCLVAIIAALSLAPTQHIPRIGPSIVEHLIAYGGALTVLLALAPAGSSRRTVAIAATLAAAGLEIVQPMVGRESTLSDFAGGAAGVWLAYVLVVTASALLRRWVPTRPRRR